MDNDDLYSIGDVSETLFLPLYCRAIESQSKNPIINDPKAVEIVQKLNKEFSKSDRKFYRELAKGKLPSKLPVTMALRTKKFDDYIRNYLKHSPNGIVVNIGCGLDTRFFHHDNGELDWYDLDFPEVIEFKKQFIQESERYHYIASSALDFKWIDELSERNDRPFFVYAEGVFMYLHEDEVKSLVLKLQSSFPGAELACEVANKKIIKLMQGRLGRRKFQRRLHLKEGVTYHFGIEKSDDFEKWSPKIKFLDEWTYFDEPEKKLGWLRMFKNFKLFRYAQWTVHYKFV